MVVGEIKIVKLGEDRYFDLQVQIGSSLTRAIWIQWSEIVIGFLSSFFIDHFPSLYQYMLACRALVELV